MYRMIPKKIKCLYSGIFSVVDDKSSANSVQHIKVYTICIWEKDWSFVSPLRLLWDPSTKESVKRNFYLKKSVAIRYFINALLVRRVANIFSNYKSFFLLLSWREPNKKHVFSQGLFGWCKDRKNLKPCALQQAELSHLSHPFTM